MKKAKKPAICGVITALSCTVMLLSYFPYFTYAVPALAGIFAVVLLLEYGARWAFLSYAVASVISFVSAETEAKILFIFFFGYYPILKGIIEKHLRPVFAYPVKIICFNAAVVAAYFVLTAVFGVSIAETEGFTQIMLLGLLGLGNIVFLFYDHGLRGVAAVYFSRIRPNISRYL